MTAQASLGFVFENQAFELEMRSVNHRQLDLEIYVPSGLGDLEARARGLLLEKLFRGKVHLRLRGDFQGAVERISLQEDALENWLQFKKVLDDKIGHVTELGFSDILKLPGVVTQSRDPGLVGAFSAVFEENLKELLEQFLAFRRREGKSLAEALKTELLMIEAGLREQEPHLEGLEDSLKKTLDEKVRSLCYEGLDPQRLAQEVALLLQKADIQEERVRLEIHLKAFLEELSGEGPVGRRLQFLVQEMHQEIQTMGSKSSDLALSRIVIKMKEGLEKIREQLMNVE